MPITNLAPPLSDVATKMYIDKNLCIQMHSSPPPNPLDGDIYYDQVSGQGYIWLTGKWIIFSSNEKQKTIIPTSDELEKHPSLRQAWEEYLVIRKLLGL
jgi:hypothetical protein